MMENSKMAGFVGIVSVPSTEIPSGKFVDLRPPEGQAYLLSIGVVSAPSGACVVSIRDATGGMDLFQAPAGAKNAGGTVIANHDSWIQINNVDFGGGIAIYAVSGVVVKIAAPVDDGS